MFIRNLSYFVFFISGEKLVHNISSVYEDYTYQPTGSGRPSARLVSNALFRQNTSIDSGGSYNNRTALFAFFGRFELKHTTRLTLKLTICKLFEN